MADREPGFNTLAIHAGAQPDPARHQKSMLISPEDIPGLLGKIADLIGERATRRMQ
jgi:hypothetical protein